MARLKEGRTQVSGLQPVQMLAALVGLVYLAFGIIGLIVTGFGDFAGSTGSTLWVFAVNPLHNIIHIVVGVLGVLMAVKSSGARTYGWLLLVAFGVLLLWGLAVTGVFATNPVSGLGNPLALNAADNWLHLGTALLGLIIAVMPARKAAGTPGGTSDAGDRMHTARAPAEESRQPRGRKLWRRGTAH
ncbi:DUF4383 domain-containing protein [Saccharomonospora halophila]|uniref:DUF4383 domain-containing protein n=1 Tax=Saccharomonospora halophila TaxID=129922 RepID=UPI00048C19AA|nr:DUF4383 domain-containing protein [Saccharomonospora halophila]